MDEASIPAERRQGQKSSRGKGNYKPKGRVADPQARAEIIAILGEEPPRRDLLIEAPISCRTIPASRRATWRRWQT